jgi:hypothetical protein
MKRKKGYRDTQTPPHDEKPHEREIKERARPHAGFALTFDTETFRFKHGQSVRYGIYQLRGIDGEARIHMHKNLAKYPRTEAGDAAYRNELNTPFEIGLFYNPICSDPKATARKCASWKRSGIISIKRVTERKISIRRPA